MPTNLHQRNGQISPISFSSVQDLKQATRTAYTTGPIKKKAQFSNTKPITENNAFKSPYLLGATMGLPFWPSLLEDKETDIGRSMKLWCFFMSALKIGTFFFSMFSLHHLINQTFLRLTYYAYNSCGILSMVWMIVKRKKIYAAVRNVGRLIRHIDPGASIGSRFINIQMWALVIFILFFFIIQAMFFFNQTITETVAAAANRSSDDNTTANATVRYLFFDIYQAMLLFTYTTNLVTMIVAFLVCHNAYLTLGNIMTTFGKWLRNQLKTGYDDQESAVEGIAIFRRIVFCVKDVESAVCTITFFVYAASLSWLFNSLNLTVIRSNVDRGPIIFIFVTLTFAMAMTTFFLITDSAFKIKEEHEKLKRLTMKFYEVPLSDCSSSRVLDIVWQMGHCQSLTELADVIRSSTLVMSGGDMFVIDKSLILSMIGLLVTYGLLIYNIDNED